MTFHPYREKVIHIGRRIKAGRGLAEHSGFETGKLPAVTPSARPVPRIIKSGRNHFENPVCIATLSDLNQLHGAIDELKSK